jgi:hypothetical protein
VPREQLDPLLRCELATLGHGGEHLREVVLAARARVLIISIDASASAALRNAWMPPSGTIT